MEKYIGKMSEIHLMVFVQIRLIEGKEHNTHCVKRYFVDQ